MYMVLGLHLPSLGSGRVSVFPRPRRVWGSLSAGQYGMGVGGEEVGDREPSLQSRQEDGHRT